MSFRGLRHLLRNLKELVGRYKVGFLENFLDKKIILWRIQQVFSSSGFDLVDHSPDPLPGKPALGSEHADGGESQGAAARCARNPVEAFRGAGVQDRVATGRCFRPGGEIEL